MRRMIFLALVAISGAAQAATPISGRWITDEGQDWRGRIYDPEVRKWTHSIVVSEAGGLNAQGCILFSCRAQQWKPAR